MTNKFRVRDTVLNKWTDEYTDSDWKDVGHFLGVSDLGILDDFYIGRHGPLFFCQLGGERVNVTNVQHMFNQDRFKVYWYIGAKDSSGKEILEGDIIEVVEDEDEETKQRVKVVFQDYCWQFSPALDFGAEFRVDFAYMENSCDDYGKCIYDIKIIGHIETHPELLEGK